MRRRVLVAVDLEADAAAARRLTLLHLAPRSYFPPPRTSLARSPRARAAGRQSNLLLARARSGRPHELEPITGTRK